MSPAAGSRRRIVSELVAGRYRAASHQRDDLRALVPFVSSLAASAELIYWPALQIITWGLETYISQNAGFLRRPVRILIGAVILWDILFASARLFDLSFSRRCGRAISAT